jgi:hypothetical protein
MPSNSKTKHTPTQWEIATGGMNQKYVVWADGTGNRVARFEKDEYVKLAEGGK